MGLDLDETRALDALLVSPTIASAAKRAHVSELELRSFLRRSEVQQALSAARRDSMLHAAARLQAAAAEAADGLLGVVRDLQASASARVAACRTILEQAHRAVELDDLAQRLEELEAWVAGGGESFQ